MSRVEVRISGLGGQGVVLAGRILGLAAVYDGKKVVQTQSYGAEARGSAAKSELIISDDQIGFPAVRKCDVLIAMSQEALELHGKDLKEKAILFVDEDLIQHVSDSTAQIYKLPVTKMAEARLKSRIYANLIMLGALTSVTKNVSREALEKAIKTVVRASTVEANLKAFEIGFNLGLHACHQVARS